MRAHSLAPKKAESLHIPKVSGFRSMSAAGYDAKRKIQQNGTDAPLFLRDHSSQSVYAVTLQPQ